MSLLPFRYNERRRTLRVALSLPVVVHGQNDQGEKFCVRVMTRAVNQQGALLVMDEMVIPGQSLLLVNENTSRSTETRVAHVRRERDGKPLVGLEFVNPRSEPLEAATSRAASPAIAAPGWGFESDYCLSACRLARRALPV